MDKTPSYNPRTGVIARASGILMTARPRPDGDDGKRYMQHRLAWFQHHGHWPKYQIDHINGNRADNRSTNLREADRTINARNSKKQAHNTSGYTCVYRQEDHKK